MLPSERGRLGKDGLNCEVAPGKGVRLFAWSKVEAPGNFKADDNPSLPHDYAINDFAISHLPGRSKEQAKSLMAKR